MAIVTGAGRGIGKAIAQRLACEGAAVAVADLDEPNARAFLSEIETAGGQSHVVEVDVTRKDNVKFIVGETVDRLGRLDIQINNAGIGIVAPLMETAENDWDALMNVNAKGVLHCSQAAARQMIAEGHGGRIINNTSGAGKMAHGKDIPLAPMRRANTPSSGSPSKWAWSCQTTGFLSIACALASSTPQCGI